MNSNDFGKLEQVDINDHWPHEASDFTPWLERNIDMLGAAIDLELEVEEREGSVGSFSVDLVCKDEIERTVIVENQLEKTDHTHLGQLLTYAAGKDAAVIVWVSKNFRDEHRAALDWLNDSTGDSLHFFGVQIEMWRIGESKPAPKFNVICKPNEWTKTERVEMTPTQKLRFDFWTGLRDHMNQKGIGEVNPATPRTGHAVGFSVGKTGFRLNALVGFLNDTVSVQLVIRGPKERAKANFHLLYQEKDDITNEIGSESLKWRPLPDRKECQVRLRREHCGVHEKKNWDELHEWLHTHLEKFHAAFHKRIRNISAEDLQALEEDDENEADEE